MYSHVSLNKLQLNIAFPEGNGLRLNKGEILKGQVKDVKDNGLILVYLKGRLIEALSEVMVKPGDMLYLMVEDFRDRKAYLKVLTPENLSRLENDALALRLREIGISPREEDIVIAKKLIQYHLPLTQENVRKISAGVRIVGEFNDKNLEIAAFALAKGIPINKETLDLLAYHLDKNTNLAKLMDNVLKFVNQYTKEPVWTDSNQPEETGGRKNIVTTTAKEVIKPETSGEEVPKPALRNSNDEDILPGLKADSSLRRETDISGLKRELTKYINLINQDMGKDFELPGKLQPLMEFLRTVLEELRLNPAVLRNNKLLGAMMKEYLEGEKDFIQVLSKVLEIVNKEENIKESKIGLEFLRSLDSMEKEINGYRLFNSISRQGLDNNFNYYYFAWPVKLDDSTHLLEMRINRERKYKNLRDADSLNIVVALDTPRMGKVLFHINWMKSYKIDLRGVVETMPVREYIDKNISELVAALKGLGYQVNYLGTKVADNREEMIISQVKLVEAAENVKPFGIDVTV